MEKIKRRKFGKTGFEVTEVSLGAMNLRLTPSVADGEKMIDYALDCGINLIDTARVYNGTTSGGELVESEILVGRVLGRRKMQEPIIVVTKGHGYTPDEFDKDLSESLERLNVRQDGGKLFIGETEIKLVYFFHGISKDRYAPIAANNTLAHAKKRKDEGKFHYLGFSSHYGDSVEIKAMLDAVDEQGEPYTSVVELPYSIYNRSLGEGENLIKYAYDKGVAVINMKAFFGNQTVLLKERIEEICSITYSDMLRFCLSNPYVSTVDAGTKYPSEMEANISYSLKPSMSADERQALIEKADKAAPFFKNTCRECMHCYEKFSCPHGLDFVSVLGLHARYVIAREFLPDTQAYFDDYAALETHGDQCKGCKACLEWCELHLDIPALMKSAHGLLSQQK